MLAEYEILGIDKNATRAEITTAYRRAAMRCHPDRHPNDPEAKKRFQEIERARRLLLSITPQVRLVRETPPATTEVSREEEAAAEKNREIQRQAARAAAAEKWRELRDSYQKQQEERRRQWEAREQQQEQSTANIGKINSPWWSIACLLISPLAGQFPTPISIIVFSALLLLASFLWPNKTYNDNYLGLVFTRLFTQGIKIYFIALATWFLIKIAKRLI